MRSVHRESLGFRALLQTPTHQYIIVLIMRTPQQKGPGFESNLRVRAVAHVREKCRV